MKTITKLFLMLVAIVASTNLAKAVESAFCQTTVTHFNIAAETNSAIKLTISNIDATSMYVEIESANADPVDLLLVNNGSGATISDATVSAPGKLRRTLTWTTAPTNVSIELLWSKVSMGGNWMLNTFSVPFAASCSGGGGTTPPPSGLATIDYETVGNNWTWTIFENGDNSPALYSVVANPSATGINTSASVAKYIINANGQPWAGVESNDLTDFTFSAENCIVKIMVYKSIVSDFVVKFEGAGGTAFEKRVANTLTNQWELLTFDFTNNIGSTVSKLVIFPDFPSTRTAGSTNYWDNISFNATQAPVVLTEPATAAPTPIYPASNVISMFSGAYTNVGVDTWRTSWSNATYSEVQIAGNATKKYDNLVFVGIETTGANLINLANMTHFHADIWTPDMTTFRVKLVDFGANGVWNGGGDDVEHELSFNPTLSEWYKLDIPLANFTGMTTKNHFAQLIFSGAPTGKVFIDNVLFYNNTATNVAQTHASAIKLYPNPAMNELNIRSDKNIVSVDICNLLGQTIQRIELNRTSGTINVSDLKAGNYLLRTTDAEGNNSVQKFSKF